MLVSLDLFPQVISLELSQDLDDRPLQLSSRHQRSVVWGSESFFSDLDSGNWLHSVTDLFLAVCHEATFALSLLEVWSVRHVKDEDVTFLLKLYLVEHLDRRVLGVNIVMEVMNVVLSKTVKLSYFHHTRCCSLEQHFNSMVHLHEYHMENVDAKKDIDLPLLNLISAEEETHYSQVDHEQKGISSGNPPVNSCVVVTLKVETSLDDQSVECTLLHSRLNSNI